MKNLELYIGLFLLLFFLWWYYRILSKIFKKYWWVLFSVIHIGVIVAYNISESFFDLSLKLYLLVPFVLGIFLGIQKMLKTNFSVNLIDWNKNRHDKNDLNNDGLPKTNNLSSTLIILCIGLLLFVLFMFFRR
jgi:hypothetical protein